jgi:hypothetical protein
MAIDTAGRRAARLARFWVTAMWWVVVGFTALVAAVVILSPVLVKNGVNSLAINVESEGAPGTAVPLSSTDAARVFDAQLEVAPGAQKLQFRTSRPGLVLLVMTSLLPVLLGALVVAYQLRAFLGDVLDGDVFTPANASRLSRLAWVTIALGIAAPLAEYATSWLILRTVPLSGAVLSPAASSDTWAAPVAAGLILLVLAAAWRYGAELQRERDLTV